MKPLFLIMFALGLIWSGICPHDYFTWFLEVLPAMIGLIVLVATYRQFQFTNLVYGMILIHCWILFIGGHYTYAEVPLFDHLRDWLHQSRNNYDKVGHFAQGFVPAFIVHELFVRKHIVRTTSWLLFLIMTVCMAISVTYEFIEWGVALATGEAADAFLGSQGYVWDTQSDMMWATMGAICMILLFRRWHQRAIHKMMQAQE
ncbi:DUF2238 domain-containing protein [Breznakibacter xylanolyticus]|nr:DUF2238 domain-containing protein [Breznakibacter xylanolyticus]